MYKTIKANLLGLLLIFLTSCTEEPVQTVREVQPKAVEGWDNGQKVVYVTDNSGQQFLMNYLLFTSLMNSGGYNNVVHHYHQSPSSYRSTSSTFKASKPINSFTNSYRTAKTSNNVYKPTLSKVERRSATLNRAKAIYNKPKVTSTINLTKKSTSYSSPSRSSYKPSSSYRSSSRSSFSKSRSSFRSSRH